MHCKSLWIKASAKCINVNVKRSSLSWILVFFPQLETLFCSNIREGNPNLLDLWRQLRSSWQKQFVVEVAPPLGDSQQEPHLMQFVQVACVWTCSVQQQCFRSGLTEHFRQRLQKHLHSIIRIAKIYNVHPRGNRHLKKKIKYTFRKYKYLFVCVCLYSISEKWVHSSHFLLIFYYIFSCDNTEEM